MQEKSFQLKILTRAYHAQKDYFSADPTDYQFFGGFLAELDVRSRNMPSHAGSDPSGMPTYSDPSGMSE